MEVEDMGAVAEVMEEGLEGGQQLLSSKCEVREKFIIRDI